MGLLGQEVLDGIVLEERRTRGASSQLVVIVCFEPINRGVARQFVNPTTYLRSVSQIIAWNLRNDHLIE